VVEQASVSSLNILSNLIGGLTITIAATCHYGTHSIPVSFEAWAPLVGYALAFPLIGSSLYFYAFRTVKPWIIASFLSLEVVYGLIVAVLLMSEKLAPLQGCGAVVLLLATLLIAAYRRREERLTEARNRLEIQTSLDESADQLTPA
jgi:drug/metabolite transporter (DMT)-like permease